MSTQIKFGTSGWALGEQRKELCNQVGSYYPQRENFRLTPEAKEKFTEKLKSDPREFCGHKVSQVVRIDGLELIFEDGSWVCYRLSGTEPVVQVYSEARTEQDLEKLSAAAKQWVFDREKFRGFGSFPARNTGCARWP